MKTALEKGKHDDIFTQNMDSKEEKVLQNLPREGNAVFLVICTQLTQYVNTQLRHPHENCLCTEQGKCKKKNEIYQRFP